MAKLPSILTYNDLNGEEATEIIMDWVHQLVKSHPLMQRHLTLPMADIHINLDIDVDMHIGGAVFGATPENLKIGGKTTLCARINAAPIDGGRPPDMVREQHNLPVSKPGYGSREVGSHMFMADIVEETAQRQAPKLPEVQPQRQSVRDSEVAMPETYVHASECPVGIDQIPEQHIDIAAGGIDIDLSGKGRMRQGDMVVTAGSHVSSKKVLGDGGGTKYGSVSGTYDLGPAGLDRGQNNRSRIKFK